MVTEDLLLSNLMPVSEISLKACVLIILTQSFGTPGKLHLGHDGNLFKSSIHCVKSLSKQLSVTVNFVLIFYACMCRRSSLS